MLIEVLGKNIYYESFGDKEPKILLVHGWSGSSNSLKALAKLLSAHSTVAVLDLPGHGKSDLPEPNWGVDEFANVITSFIEKINFKYCVYIGHSFGGALGVYIAALRPELINKLILCAPSYHRSSTKNKNNSKRVFHSLLKNSINGPKWMKKLYYRIVFPNSDLYKMPLLESNFRKIISTDLSQFAGKITLPTLIVWGDKDKYVNVDDAYLLNKYIPNSKLKIFEGATHGLPITNPELVYKEVSNFIDIK